MCGQLVPTHTHTFFTLCPAIMHQDTKYDHKKLKVTKARPRNSGGGSGFFLAYEDYGEGLMAQLICTNFTLLGQGPVYNSSASLGCEQEFLEKLLLIAFI